MPVSSCSLPVAIRARPADEPVHAAQDLPRGDRVGLELGRVVVDVRLQRPERRRAPLHVARARATAGLQPPPGPTLPRLRSADWTADWALFDRVDQLATRRRRSAASITRASSSIASSSSRAPLLARCAAELRRLAPAPGLGRRRRRARWVCGTAALVPSRDLARAGRGLPQAGVQLVGAGGALLEAPVQAPGRRQQPLEAALEPRAAGGRPTRSGGSGCAAPRCARAATPGPSTASMPG